MSLAVHADKKNIYSTAARRKITKIAYCKKDVQYKQYLTFTMSLAMHTDKND